MPKKTAIFILIFVVGFIVGKLHPTILKAASIVVASSDKSSSPFELAATIDFAEHGVDKTNIEKIRSALWIKIFGDTGIRVKPFVRPIGKQEFESTYLDEASFNEFYKEMLEEGRIEISEVSGTFAELGAYTWKTLLLRQKLSASRRLFILHHGHDGNVFDFERSNTVVRDLLDKGYDVLVASMPGIGWNRIENIEVRTWDGTGYLVGLHHNKHGLFEMIDTGSGHYIKYFVEPVISSIDVATSSARYEKIAMAGDSGGAWTTTLVSAMDTRVDVSISFSGTLPFFARHKAKDLGDPEQFDVSFYREFTYPMLYELASVARGQRRVHYQVFNKADYCCFDEDSVSTFQRYVSSRKGTASGDIRIDVFDGDHHGYTAETFTLLMRRSGLEPQVSEGLSSINDSSSRAFHF